MPFKDPFDWMMGQIALPATITRGLSFTSYIIHHCKFYFYLGDIIVKIFKYIFNLLAFNFLKYLTIGSTYGLLKKFTSNFRRLSWNR